VLKILPLGEDNSLPSKEMRIKFEKLKYR